MGERELLVLLDAFIKSKVLMTAYRLDVFTLLARESMTTEQVLRRLDLPSRSGTILINACLALGLLEISSDRLQVPEGISPFLIRDDNLPFRMPTYLIDYYRTLYDDLSILEEIVRTDGAASEFRLRDYFKEDVSEVDPQLAADYSAYMDATMAKIAQVVLEVYSFSHHRYLFDLCGGTGAFCEAVLNATPGIAGGFIDIPAVAEIARRRNQGSTLASRLDVIGGDVFRHELPSQADVMTICRSAHDWDDERMFALFQRVADALPRGGRLLVIERMIPDSFTPRAAALYLRAIYFLSKSRTASYRRASDYHAALRRAGFGTVETLDPKRDPYEFFQGLRIVMATKS